MNGILGSFSLEGKVAVVTGGAQGIGKVVAHALAEQGANIALIDLNDASALAAEIAAAHGVRATALTCNVTDPAQVADAIAGAAAELGPLDLLFNNAGVSNPPGPFEDWTPEQWRGVVDLNLNGMFYCLQQAFRTMRAQSPRGGRIINNGSISATTPRPNSIAYTATKHAVKGMTKTAALDGRKYDIAVGQIDVGNAMTELAAKMAKGVPQANGEIAIEPMIDVAIVGQSLLYMANLPLEANVMFHTVMATKMPFAGRG